MKSILEVFWNVFILNIAVQPKMRYHGNGFFKNSIQVKDFSFILVKTVSQYHKNNQRHCVSCYRDNVFHI